MNQASLTSPRAGRHEKNMVVLLSLGFGLIGLDRFIILPLFPAIMRDLGMNYQDLGNLSAALAMAWGFAALGIGGLVDKLGRKNVLVGSLLLVSALSGLSALAAGLVTLLLLRALMGICEGMFTPTGITVTIEVSHPSRRGFNLGIQQALFPILGLALGPLIAASLLETLHSWRGVFAIVALPGFLLAWLIARHYTPVAGRARPHRRAGTFSTWLLALRHGNIRLNILIMFCILSCQFVLCAMLPNYLTDHLRLSTMAMAFVISAIGVGGCVGQLIIPGLSDLYGRKPVVMLSFAASAALVAILSMAPPQPWLLFCLLFGISFFNCSLTCLAVGPLTSESVPPALLPAATGIVVGLGEILGGGASPALAGFVATHYGLPAILRVALGGSVGGLALSCLLKSPEIIPPSSLPISDEIMPDERFSLEEA
ncbi:MFS transporter permease [Chromobacterium sphagni]|uniref:MFS transporter permease n=1 Tax=Chromobacterium sphagni TaxID=1903179 RepID=A0A1S1X5C2_9NEIS|nr:MFS transporter [Chromobacterium sphagni]OHX14406.1 MFS transporter permease [Chromobacterium sphagni]